MVGRNLRPRKGDDVEVEESNQETDEPLLPSTSARPKPKTRAKVNSKKSPAKVHFEDEVTKANDSGSDLSDPPPSPPKPLFPKLPSTPSKTKKGIEKPKPKAPPKPKPKAAPKSKAGKAKVSETPEIDLAAIAPSALAEKDPNVPALLPQPPAAILVEKVPETAVALLPQAPSAAPLEKDPNLPTISSSASLENHPNIPAHSSQLHQLPNLNDAPPPCPLSPSSYPFGTIPSSQRQGTPEGSAPTPPWHLSASPEPEHRAAERVMDISTSPLPPTVSVNHPHEVGESPAFEPWTPETEFQRGGGVENGMTEAKDVDVNDGNVEEKTGNVEGLWKASENNPRCPSCVSMITGGAAREDVSCFGGPPCVQCRGKGWSEEECASGRLVEIGKGRKRGRVD